MRFKVSVLIPLSVVLGLGAVQAGRSWLDREMDARARVLETASRAKPQAFSTLVVASEPLRFGMELKTGMLKEIPWATDQLPKGAYSKISDLFKVAPRRLALSAIEVNEPVLEAKVTGPGQKANLAAIIEEGKKAITVRVDDVVGVAGFVLPGDRVDVLLTRKANEQNAISDNILQNIKVLAVDQKADDRIDKPSVARAVTLEVSTQQAQRLNVAQNVGRLSLILRPVGPISEETLQRVSSSELASSPDSPAGRPATGNTSVSVIRSTVRKDYSVPIEGERP